MRGLHSRPGIALALAMLFTGVMGAPPASAAATHQPDGRIQIDCSGVAEWRMCPGTWTGAGIHNATARDQKAVWYDYMDYATEPDPRVMYFRISIRNAGTVADRYLVNADGVTSGYRVSFLRRTSRITDSVENGTYMTPVIAPGGTFLIRAKVAMLCDQEEVTYCGQDRANRLVTIRSHSAPTAVDAVRFIRKLWVCTC